MISLNTLVESAVTFLDCEKSEAACPSTETVVLTCEISSLYVQWTINDTELIEFTSDFYTVNSSQLTSSGLFLARLVSIDTTNSMMMSTLKFNYSLVGEGAVIKCKDGINGGEKQCETKSIGIT